MADEIFRALIQGDIPVKGIGWTEGAASFEEWQNLLTFLNSKRAAAPALGDPTAATLVLSGSITQPALLTNGAPGTANSAHRILVKKTGIADNTTTPILNVTVPNASQAAAIELTLLSSNGGADAFESSRVAKGLIVITRTAGVATVAVVATLALAQIATVAAGATHTLAYAVTAMSGAVGATQTFSVNVTIDDTGNLGGSQVVALAELINSEASGVTFAAAA